MKLILTVETFKSGEKNGVVWASATGLDALGRRARAAFRDPREGEGRKRATAMIEQMTGAIPAGQDVADIKPIVECFGSWRDRPVFQAGKQVMRGGEPAMERYFEVASFNLLSGPALELRRTKQRASEIVDVVAASLEAGDPIKAAEAALEFLRVFSGRPADELEDVDADEPDEAGPDTPVAAEGAATGPDSPEASLVEVRQQEVREATVETVVEAGSGVEDAAAVEADAPVVEDAAGEVPVDAAPAPAPAAEIDGDFESLVAAVEAAPPVHPEPVREQAAAPVRPAVARPDHGKAPPTVVAAPRQPLPPRPPAVAPRPMAAPAVRPVSSAPVRPVGVAAPASQAAGPRPVVQQPAVRQVGAQAPQRTAAPASAPRVAPTAAIAPPAGGYRQPEQGEDPEALAAAHIARRQRTGPPPAVRSATVRPIVR